jgi:LysM repeat protein
VYVVQPGDSLNQIAIRYRVSPGKILAANGLVNPDFLAVGQILTIPPPDPQPPGPSLKILPDSELVNGPASVLFDLPGEVARRGGLLSRYTEVVEGEELSGTAIVQLVAQRYSVNPRLLLAVLEHQAGWLTRQEVAPQAWAYPIGYYGPGFEGLFAQLSWAADQLNAGYYRWKAGWAGPYLLADGGVVAPGSGINAATASLQALFAQLYPVDSWRQVVDQGGFVQTYQALFGDPFQWAVEPLVPSDERQPPLQLPFEGGKVWSFTGGPHSSWGAGAAWAALDFAPPGDALGCVRSDEWVVAAADGLIVRAEEGEVIQDLDGDGFEQTGWVLLYMHVESRDRVASGARLRAGDRIGHPSCEGGVADGTHVHLARKYNGEWIPADGPRPFDLDGWVSGGLGAEYDGTLSRGSVSLDACACRNPENQISR